MIVFVFVTTETYNYIYIYMEFSSLQIDIWFVVEFYKHKIIIVSSDIFHEVIMHHKFR